MKWGDVFDAAMSVYEHAAIVIGTVVMVAIAMFAAAAWSGDSKPAATSIPDAGPPPAVVPRFVEVHCSGSVKPLAIPLGDDRVAVICAEYCPREGK